MTWWLWLVLVLGALLTYTLIALSLWRRGKTLLGALEALSRVTEPLQEAAAAAPQPSEHTPAFLRSPGDLAAVREQRRTNLAARRGRRWTRSGAARARWYRLGLG